MSNNINIARGLTSIIVPVWNQIEFTQQCIATLKSHTRPAWELIVIDNGSTDGTGTYLAGVRDMSTVPVTVVSNATNVGFPAAINQGLRLARGEYLVMLNNDVVVTDGWLDQLIALVNANRGIDAERGGASGNASADGGGRPSVRMGAGSGDPRTAPAALGAGDESSSDGAGVPDFEVCVGDAAGPTPPGPPFTKGGKVIVPASIDSAAAGVEEDGSCAVPSSLPTADCLLPTARPIGLVGPMSNYAAPPQLVEEVPYRDIADMHWFARQWREQHLGTWFNAPKLSGFCLLMKRAVYDAIGGLDERFGIGFFDDDDLAERTAGGL